MSARVAYIDGLALWAPSLPGWEFARAVLRGVGVPVDPPARRPDPELLPPAERRRAPDAVALALEVAGAAVAQSGHRASELLSVFASAHGDLATTDYLCRTLVSAPTLISPTRFHNSVHNAASGYWGIATHSMQPSTALSALDHSFAAGLFEALTQCAADAQPVLLVGHDTAACGPLISTNESRGLLAVALVLAPRRSQHSRYALEWDLCGAAATPPAPRSAAAKPLAANAMADALPLIEALACGASGPLDLPLGATRSLRVQALPLV
jgi:hypothetical protein